MTRPNATAKAPDALIDGRVIAAFGRHFRVETSDAALLECVSRGRKHDVACGDRVLVREIARDQGVIERVEPRSSLLYRSDAFRHKLIAANVDQVLLVLAGKPAYSEELLSRCLIAAEAADVDVLVVLNKADLEAETLRAEQDIAWLSTLGYRLVKLHAKHDIAPLRALLAGRLSVLVGQSGMGKSTIVNALVPGAAARTGAVSEALDAGKHTTTHASLHRLDDGGEIIDSPGLQEFGLIHIDPQALAWACPEFRPYLGQCRFHNCRHLSEPGCAISAALAGGALRQARVALYRRLMQQSAAAHEQTRGQG